MGERGSQRERRELLNSIKFSTAHKEEVGGGVCRESTVL